MPSAIAILLAAALPFTWVTGERDAGPEPKGRLLTDNPGWHGRAVYTGVEYSFEPPVPDNPGDWFGEDRTVNGRRLLDGKIDGDWHVPVGSTEGDIKVVFDFKRGCVFNEVDLFSSRTEGAISGEVFASVDGKSWRKAGEFEGAKTRPLRIALRGKAEGRYLKLAAKAQAGQHLRLDEVLVWGEAKKGEKTPEAIKPIPYHGELQVSEKRDGGVKIVPIGDIAYEDGTGFLDSSIRRFVDSSVENSSIRRFVDSSILMAVSETESRYFAVVNETAKRVAVPVKIEGAGDGVESELLVGGLVRIEHPTRKLTARERFDMTIVGEDPKAGDLDRLGFFPFFSERMIPEANFLAKRIANPWQVKRFPKAMGLNPGEAAVVMVKLTTKNAKPGKRAARLVAGNAALTIDLTVADFRLSEQRPWVYAWNPFTRQFPYESAARLKNDAEAMIKLGVTHYFTWPDPGTKGEYVMKHLENSTFADWMTHAPVFNRAYAGKVDELTDEDKEAIRESYEQNIARAKRDGLPLERLFLELPDEPGVRSSHGVGEMAKYAKVIHPEIGLFSDPSFWMGENFANHDLIYSRLGDWFDLVDISVPYRTLVEDADNRAKLFAKPRRVKAQYAHPPRRAGRSIAWNSIRYGLDGFAFWTYFAPSGDPWDMRTWDIYEYDRCEMVFPLENGVAITPLYETMREAVEDYRLLKALEERGETAKLKRLIDDFAASRNPDGIEGNVPYRFDFDAARVKAMTGF